jgi:catechol 2,3-dioxygenase-like lactoylglutathione lyase family enzyme
MATNSKFAVARSRCLRIDVNGEIRDPEQRAGGRTARRGLHALPLRSRAIELRGDEIENQNMKTRCFDHIDLRVKDMEVARKFYGKFLPELGFLHESPGDDFHTFYAGGSNRPLEFFGFTEDKNHRSNGTRIAFWADTREEVDQISKLVRDAGGKNLEGPEVCEDYSPGYYAFFFEDPDLRLFAGQESDKSNM